MDQPGQKEIKDAYARKGYRFFTGRENINLWGVRSANLSANSFNDWLGITYQFRDGGVWCHFAFPATTDPGAYWRKNPMNVHGTAVLKPSQYPGAYKVGVHKGYSALQQKRPVTVWRDRNRDAILDITGVDEHSGMFGINIHRATDTGTSVVVDKWSAGCQVLADSGHFAFLMDMCRRSAQLYLNSFTYTLFEQRDLKI
jgi:hypothetical protein